MRWARLLFFLGAGCTHGVQLETRPDAGEENGSHDATAIDATSGDGDAEDDAGEASDAEVTADAGSCFVETRLPHGARVSEDGAAIEVRVFSSRATAIAVEFFAEPFGESSKLTQFLAREDGDVWSAVIPRAALEAGGLGAVVYWGYRAWGPNWAFDPTFVRGSTIGFSADVDQEGNRFNPNKLLIDPYARELSHDPLNGHHREANVFRSGPEFRAIDDAPFKPKAVLFGEEPVPCFERPERAFKEEIIYEVHLRGLTQNDLAVPEALRGTYAGAALKAPYLRDLGITAIELLPVHETQNDTNDLEEGTQGDNYWGYSTLGYFAPDRRYSADRTPGGPTREFRAMVRAFHAEGLKVYIDVVYNHTAEGGAWMNGAMANILSWRGLDNAAYYELAADPSAYVGSNGVGPNVNVAAEPVRAMILDSMRYWKESLGVDGFRFDLAAVLGNGCARECFRFEPDLEGNVLLRARELAPIDLIAEPWGIGPGTYQVGNFPAGWAEWNDRFRDTIRADQNRIGAETITPNDLIERLRGSPGLFADSDRAPWATVNYVASHDGFTLRDIYSYDQKSNQQAWPYGPSSGGDDRNHSWDHDGDPVFQRQAARTGFALVMLATGVPMITGGDEFYRTQYGNNNPYNLDSIANWLDWADRERNAAFHHFAREMIQFRRAHPALRPEVWIDGKDRDGDGLPGVAFYGVDGAGVDDRYLANPAAHFLGYRIDGDENGDSARSIYIAYNGWTQPLQIVLPELSSGTRWLRVADTSAWMEPIGNIHLPGEAESIPARIYDVGAASLTLFIEE